MKKLLPILGFLLSSGLFAQSHQALKIEETPTTASIDAESTNLYIPPVLPFHKAFEEVADGHNVPHRSFSGLENVENGYYIISGIFSRKKNLGRTIKRLKRKGFDEAGYIEHPDNGLNYVFLAYYPFGLEAVDACVSKLNGTYTDAVWILEVENSMTIGGPSLAMLEVMEDGSFTTTVTNQENTRIETNSKTLLPVDANLPDVSETVYKGKIIEEADACFNKMWYAEAARLYESALSKDEKYYIRENLQKAADAHYFNTDMEKACHWYDVLYKTYGKEMSDDNLFKYAHSLKGTGKYGRAKRLMRLYNRKIGKTTNSDFEIDDTLPNEVVLDNILHSKQDFELHNLAINSEYSDFSPMFLDSNQVVFSSARDSSFFKTRKYKWNDQPFLDLYVAEINKESQDLKNATKFSKKINTKYHEASVTFSPNNATMYFTRNNYGKKLKRDKEGVNHLKIYTSHKIGQEWTEAVEVPFNSNDYSTGHPALSPDGKQLYFVSDMPGSIGDSDIFVVDILEDGTYSTPRNLGPGVNTEKREMFPFFNGKKLYFSSDGHTGLGGLDIFETAYIQDKGFGEVINMGIPFNSNKDDFSYIVNEENDRGFFASNREGGKGDDDIYSFKRPDIEEVPANNNAIAGVITELVTGDFMPKTLVHLLDENGIKLKETMTEEDGSFMFEDLDGDTKYSLKTVQKSFFVDDRPVATKDNRTINVDIPMKRLDEMITVEQGIKKLKTEMIYFEFDRSEVRAESAKELDKLVSVMKEYPNMAIKIESHTDSRGSRSYNEYLSDKRAKSTRDYIISKGIDASRIESAIGYGESQLLNECDGTVACSEETHLLNRRSEFIIVRE
ncbi:OmpA family protein [Pricia sp. S334]|uniref:OmpA family protein n=1 Tax=Pricia mediterranea TaxID=3076079 RepID=A0ABU3L5B7_9FLAO|nr:OmpA family protein [Pricia sp. S334]MDT7828914.1 OmpA family protein [Pricia sp. S334]